MRDVPIYRAGNRQLVASLDEDADEHVVIKRAYQANAFATVLTEFEGRLGDDVVLEMIANRVGVAFSEMLGRPVTVTWKPLAWLRVE